MLELEVPAGINLPGRKRTTSQLMPGLLSSHHSFLTWIFSSQCGYFPYPSLHSHLHCPLPPPLTQDQTSPQNPQTWLKGNTSFAWSLSPPSLLPCHISIANIIFCKWTSPLSHWYTTSQYHEIAALVSPECSLSTSIMSSTQALLNPFPLP